MGVYLNFLWGIILVKRGLKTDLQTLPLLYTCEIPEDKGFIYFSSEFEQVLRALGF